MVWVDKPQNYKDLYGILQLLRGSHLNNFPLKLGWVAFHSVTFQLKCLDFQSNQYNKLGPVLSRFCNWLLTREATLCPNILNAIRIFTRISKFRCFHETKQAQNEVKRFSTTWPNLFSKTFTTVR